MEQSTEQDIGGNENPLYNATDATEMLESAAKRHKITRMMQNTISINTDNMITAQQFIQEWGADDLFRFPAELVASLNIQYSGRSTGNCATPWSLGRLPIAYESINW